MIADNQIKQITSDCVHCYQHHSFKQNSQCNLRASVSSDLKALYRSVIIIMIICLTATKMIWYSSV